MNFSMYAYQEQPPASARFYNAPKAEKKTKASTPLVVNRDSSQQKEAAKQKSDYAERKHRARAQRIFANRTYISSAELGRIEETETPTARAALNVWVTFGIVYKSEAKDELGGYFYVLTGHKPPNSKEVLRPQTDGRKEYYIRMKAEREAESKERMIKAFNGKPRDTNYLWDKLGTTSQESAINQLRWWEREKGWVEVAGKIGRRTLWKIKD